MSYIDPQCPDCTTDAISVCQHTVPWIVQGVEAIARDLDCLTDSVTICPGAAPIPVTATDLDTRNLLFATDKVDISGSSVSVSGAVSIVEPITVDAVDLDIRNLLFATDKVDVSGSTIVVGPIVGAATEATLFDVKRGVTDYRVLLDYAGRLDGNPVYVGKNLQAAVLTASTWVIQRLTYDSVNRLIDAQVLTGVWNDRAILGWT